MYSAPITSSAISLLPNNEAIPAATIPRGPTQLINNFSLNLKEDPLALKNTPNGLIIKTTIANKASDFQLKIRIKLSMSIFAASKIKSMDINKTLSDSLK